MSSKDKCGQEHDNHVCEKDAGHRSWHLDSSNWSPTKGGALYEWRANTPQRNALAIKTRALAARSPLERDDDL